MRRRVLTGLIVLIAATPAHAAPRPVTSMSGLSEFAPAGEEILVSRTQDASLRVFAIPVTGGARRQVFAFDAPGGLRLERSELAASAQRAAVTIKLVRSSRDNIGTTLAFAGPVAGGWSGLPPFTDPRSTPSPLYSNSLQVDGERIITSETRGEFDGPRIVVRDPDPHEVVFATAGEATDVTFAGDLVAYRARAADESAEDRSFGDVLVVRDWRTGAVLISTDLQDDIGSIALRPDGRVAAATEGGLYEVRPGASPRLLTRRGGAVAWAGDALVYQSGDGLRVIEPSGRIRRFGAPSASLYNFATDGSRVIWEANGCLLVDDVSAPPAAAPAPGPCARSELALPAQEGPHLARTLPVLLRCVAAPRACRGTLRLSTAEEGTLAHEQAISRRVRFSIPAGHARRVRVPLTARGYRVLGRNAARAKADSDRPLDAIVIVDARTDDGERFPGEAKPDGVLILAEREQPRTEGPKGSSPAVRRVYTDYRRDGVIEICAHSLSTLKRTLATIDPEFDTSFPDFRDAIEAGINRYASCADTA